MKKYKVKNTAIMHNGTIAYEGNIIELSDEQAKRLMSNLFPNLKNRKQSQIKIQIKQPKQKQMILPKLLKKYPLS